MIAPVFKVMGADEWAAFQRRGVYPGSALDQADGFVHLSAPDQVAGTVQRHFADAKDLVVLAIDRDKLDKALRWEPSAHHGQFPHFYGELTIDHVMSCEAIPDDPDQRALAMALLAV